MGDRLGTPGVVDFFLGNDFDLTNLNIFFTNISSQLLVNFQRYFFFHASGINFYILCTKSQSRYASYSVDKSSVNASEYGQQRAN
jgi:hypothetical protein|tara:strand:+ start:142 stop:396 length:255 start_codon:yes stop_codon:yes gene_type:complete